MAETRTEFPPHNLTEDEEAALAGRFVMSPEARPDPAGSGRHGREKPPPYGVVYVRATGSETAAEPEAETEPETEAEEAEDEEAEEVEEEVDLEGWTVSELRDALETAGVEIPSGARKADLIELLKDAEAE